MGDVLSSHLDEGRRQHIAGESPKVGGGRAAGRGGGDPGGVRGAPRALPPSALPTPSPKLFSDFKLCVSVHFVSFLLPLIYLSTVFPCLPPLPPPPLPPPLPRLSPRSAPPRPFGVGVRVGGSPSSRLKGAVVRGVCVGPARWGGRDAGSAVVKGVLLMVGIPKETFCSLPMLCVCVGGGEWRAEKLSAPCRGQGVPQGLRGCREQEGDNGVIERPYSCAVADGRCRSPDKHGFVWGCPRGCA